MLIDKIPGGTRGVAELYTPLVGTPLLDAIVWLEQRGFQTRPAMGLSGIEIIKPGCEWPPRQTPESRWKCLSAYDTVIVDGEHIALATNDIKDQCTYKCVPLCRHHQMMLNEFYSTIKDADNGRSGWKTTGHSGPGNAAPKPRSTAGRELLFAMGRIAQRINT